jgi:hypothetical protein
MDRREFLKDALGALVVLPLGTFLITSCEEDDAIQPGQTTTTNPTEPDTTPPDSPPRIDGANIVYTSNEVNLHSHSFGIPIPSFDNPPLSGITGETTSAQAHTHGLNISQEALRRASTGQTVKVTSSESFGHIHVFTIVRVA